MRPWILGSELNRTPELREGSIDLPLVKQYFSQSAVTGRIIRSDGNGLPKSRSRLINHLLSQIGGAKIVGGIEVGGIQL